jgi:hypothetical protein
MAYSSSRVVDSRTGRSSLGWTTETGTATMQPEEGPMRYLLLIYTAEPTEAVPEDLMAEEMAAYDTFTRWTREKGLFEAGEALHPTSAATTVRVRDGKTIATDGPFAETKEALGGFYLIEAANLDEAIDCAARIPGAKHGSIEVRPIWELPTGVTAEAVASAH